MLNKKKISLILFILLLGSLEAISASAEQTKRGRVIDFDDELVEGLNKRPLDSANQISERDRRRRKSHLYRKRAGFKTENHETMNVLRYTP